MKTLSNLNYDVVCAGGGPAGVFAAVSAARGGAKVLLLERAGFLGGSASLGEPIYGLSVHHTPLTKDFLCLLEKLDGAAFTSDQTALIVNGETVKLAFHHLCRESGVDVLLYSEACRLRSNENGSLHITAINKSALLEIDASIAVDGTGAGSLVRSVDALQQDPPLKAGASMVVTGLKPRLLCSRCEEGFLEELSGSHYYGPLIPGGFDCAVTVCLEPHRFLVQFPLEEKIRPCDPVSRTRVITMAHTEALELFRLLTKQAGFEHVRLSNIPAHLKLYNGPSVRHPEPAEACVSEDAIAAVYDAKGDFSYVAPKQMLVSEHDRLLVCGSLAEQEAWPCEMRGISAAMITGEAAGACSALAIQRKCRPGQIAAGEIRQFIGL